VDSHSGVEASLMFRELIGVDLTDDEGVHANRAHSDPVGP